MTLPRRAAGLRGAVLLACACAACTTPPVSQPQPAPPAPVVSPPAAMPEPARVPTPAPPPPQPPPVTAQSELARGVMSYDNGDYPESEKQLTRALALGLADPADRARAHKYLAFMVCVTGREKACRDEFRAAVEADPDFALAPAEATHPVWPQVLRSVKRELARRKK